MHLLRQQWGHTQLAFCLKAGISVAAFFCSSVALAAAENSQNFDAQTNPPESKTRSTGLEEIVVTARKIEENSLDAPVSVSVFSDKAIREAGINSVEDIGRFTPGLAFPREFGRRFDRPVIRGQSNILGAPNASVFIDGIFQRGSAQIFDLSDVERVEVIKGPQSALYGRQTFSGAINYITRDPVNELRGRFRATIAERDEYEISGTIGGAAIEDVLLFQLNGHYFTYGGDRRNQFDGKRLGQQENYDVSLKTIFKPTDWLRFELRGVYAKQDDGLAETPLQPSSFNNAFLNTAGQYYVGVVPIREEFLSQTTTNIDGGGTERRVTFLSLIATADFGDGYTLTSTTGYNDEFTRDNLDLDLQGASLLGGFLEQRQRTQFRTISQEFRLDSPRDRPFRWRIGGYYYDENFFAQVNIPSFGTTTNSLTPVENIAGFASVEYDFTDQLSATAELRVARDTLALQIPANNVDLITQSTSVTPRFTLDWKPNDDTLIYAIAGKGTKPGGFSGNPERLLVVLSPEELAFQEESLWSYEIGMKATFLDDRAQVTVAGYYTDWNDQQVTVLVPGATASRTVNAGKSKVIGAEISFNLAVTPNWIIGSTLGIQEATLVQFDDATVQQELFGNPSAAGNNLPNVPPYDATFSSTYTVPDIAPGLDAFLRADALFEGSKWAQVHNLARTGSKESFNLRAGLKAEHYSITFFVNNLLNDNTSVSVIRYNDFATSNPRRRAFQTVAPKARQIGVTLDYNF